MKPIYGHFAGALAVTFAIGACVPAPDSTPPPEPVQTRPPPPPPPPPVVASPAPQNWIDAPRTPGDWAYGAVDGGTVARYSAGGRTLFSLGCMANSRRIALIRDGVSVSDGATMTVRTETADRALRTQRASSGAGSSAAVTATDPLLDAMALTRGRFAVEVPGAPTLYLPAWAEVTRVIEDCR